jgi:hypothetical protein
LYSDTAQSEGAKKAWSGIAKTSDADAIDFRVHPILHPSNNFVGRGIPKTEEDRKSGKLDPRYWIGARLPSGEYLPAEKIRFSIRGK